MSKKRRKKSPDMIREEELLSSLLENVDESESGLNEAARNVNQPN